MVATGAATRTAAVPVGCSRCGGPVLGLFGHPAAAPSCTAPAAQRRQPQQEQRKHYAAAHPHTTNRVLVWAALPNALAPAAALPVTQMEQQQTRRCKRQQRVQQAAAARGDSRWQRV